MAAPQWRAVVAVSGTWLGPRWDEFYTSLYCYNKRENRTKYD